MGQVRDLIGPQGATAAGVFGPAEHPGLEEGAIDNQLLAALEQIQQANLTLGPVELVLLLHRHPRHPSTLGGQRVTGAGQGLLLHKELLARSLPLLLRHDRRSVHREPPVPVFLVSLITCCHIITPLFSETERDDSLSKIFCAYSPRSTSSGRWSRMRALASHPARFARIAVINVTATSEIQSKSNGASTNRSTRTLANRFASTPPMKPATAPRIENSMEKIPVIRALVAPSVFSTATSRMRR